MTKPVLNSARTANQWGMTLTEVLLALVVGGMILTVSLGITQANKALLDTNQARTSSNQNIRTIVDLIGDDVRSAGERLKGDSITPPSVMPIMIDNGALILKRNLRDEVFTLCLGTTQPAAIRVSSPTGNNEDPSCGKGVTGPMLQQWQAYRQARGGTATAYIFQPNADPEKIEDEFFTYSDEVTRASTDWSNMDNNPWRRFIRTQTPLVNTYTTNGNHSDPNNAVPLPRIYLMEERRYQLDEEELQLSVNRGDSQGVARGVTNLTFSAVLNNPATNAETVVNTLIDPRDWANLKAIRMSITHETTEGRKTVERTVNAEFFPRNVLSR